MKLNRRHFMKMAVVSVTAASFGLLPGCNDGGDDDGYVIDETIFPQSVASGDPKPNSVILWTRVEDGAARSSRADATVTLQVAKDEGFSELVLDTQLNAPAEHDYCVKVKVVGLDSGAIYHYRFLYGDEPVSSPKGRTKTAPAKDADATVKFGVVVCQDYIDGYYNVYALMLDRESDLDFIVHLGDYIYEYDKGTGGLDVAERALQFPDYSPEAVAEAGEFVYSARSLDNYRYLYRAHHDDPKLKRIHELYPMIVIWDDHEFSDDCHGATGTYSDGVRDEYDPERRRNSIQAFYEYLPVDEDYDDAFVTSQTFDSPLNPTYASLAQPGTGCNRPLRFGKHLDMYLTDYRTFRPDHLIPEGAFPGKIALDKATLVAMFEAQYPGMGEAVYASQAGAFHAYVSLDNLPAPYNAYAATYQAALVGTLAAAYEAEGMESSAAATKAADDLSGNVAVIVFNSLVSGFNAATGNALPTIDDTTAESLDKGVDYSLMGKTSFFSSTGSRYGVVKATFDLLSAATHGGQPENVFGAEQQAALDAYLAASDATFFCQVNSVSTASLLWDLRNEDVFAPIGFNQLFLANVDHWDGFPARRMAMVKALQQRGKAFMISGDIHASFLTAWRPDGGPAVPDYTVSSISSTVFNRYVELTVQALSTLLTDPAMRERAQELLVDNLDDTLTAGLPAVYPGSELKFAKTKENGYIVITVEADKVTSKYVIIPHSEVKTSAYDDLSTLTVTTAEFVYDGSDVSEA